MQQTRLCSQDRRWNSAQSVLFNQKLRVSVSVFGSYETTSDDIEGIPRGALRGRLSCSITLRCSRAASRLSFSLQTFSSQGLAGVTALEVHVVNSLEGGLAENHVRLEGVHVLFELRQSRRADDRARH
eukprot:1188843-Prorocentrum_minimum.AAC.1